MSILAIPFCFYKSKEKKATFTSVSFQMFSFPYVACSISLPIIRIIRIVNHVFGVAEYKICGSHPLSLAICISFWLQISAEMVIDDQSPPIRLPLFSACDEQPEDEK